MEKPNKQNNEKKNFGMENCFKLWIDEGQGTGIFHWLLFLSTSFKQQSFSESKQNIIEDCAISSSDIYKI